MFLTDTIVFTQKELNKAIDNGCTVIALCDNSFKLPPVPGIRYVGIGNVTASIDFDNPGEHGIICTNFSPKTKKRPKIVHIENKAVGIASLMNGSYKGSYSSSYKIGSYASSYKIGSFISSYRLSSSYRTSFFSNYRHEYRYRTSHFGSYFTSYRLGTSYRIMSSFKITSFMRKFRHKFDYILTEISVNGYGIHLI